MGQLEYILRTELETEKTSTESTNCVKQVISFGWGKHLISKEWSAQPSYPVWMKQFLSNGNILS